MVILRPGSIAEKARPGLPNPARKVLSQVVIAKQFAARTREPRN
jgi:hypothetical protein